MKIHKYKPGEHISSSDTKNNYYQAYFTGKLLYKGYVNKNNFIGYKEEYRVWRNKGVNLKYIL
jgi:hypothetical protein